jgi:cytochrome oxidase Cu insertion factor (SCO1/SenC/PrrC family)
LDHSSSITVLDRQGRVAATIGSTDTIARSVTTLRDILRKP